LSARKRIGSRENGAPRLALLRELMKLIPLRDLTGELPRDREAD
jgi:hypothetical protein